LGQDRDVLRHGAAVTGFFEKFSDQRPAMLSAARRLHFLLFVMKCFETLHPGAPPLHPAWYLKAICHALVEVHHGRERRLVITVPPRHLKSITASVAYVAWLLGHDPTARIMESDWYKRDFPAARISDRGNRALELETTAGGVRKAVSVGGSITGFGAELIIVDDCMKADEARSPTVRQELRAWYDNTLLTRLNDKAAGKIISIQRRLHEDDLPAYLLEEDYRHLSLSEATSRGAVHVPGDCRCRPRFGQERVPSPRDRCARPARRPSTASPRRGSEVLCQATALLGRHGGLRLGPLLGPRDRSTWPSGTTDAASLRESVREARQNRCCRCRGNLRGGDQTHHAVRGCKVGRSAGSS
jgi:hypothetical protein